MKIRISIVKRTSSRLSPCSTLKKLTSLKRREFFSRAVVMKPAGYCICLIVLLNSRVYMGGTGYVFRSCLPKHIALLQRYSDLISPNVSLIMGDAASLQTSKGSILDPFASGVLLQLRHLSSFFT